LFSAAFARTAAGSGIAASYQVIEKSGHGPQTLVRMQIHLSNRSERDLHILRLTLWDFPHPDKNPGKTEATNDKNEDNKSRACSLVVRAGSTSDTTQEFTVPRSEYRLWRRGAHPRLLLDVQTPGGRTVTEPLRLDPQIDNQTSSRKAN
jgi:hypothetical protein